jgi:heptosyltransferase I
VRVLIVKLSSLGDVVHAMPVVHDIRNVYSGARIDWVVEPAFAPLVRRVQGIGEVIECAQRRWRKRWWTGAVRAEWREFKRKLTAERYDAVIDLQGLTKSALVARMAQGPSFGLANKTEGSGYEWPARWLIDQAIEIAPRIHALDRSRELAARALNYQVSGSPYFGLLSHAEPLAQPTVVFVHGTSRDDKLWPEASWVELGQRMVASGFSIALPHAGEAERARAERVARAIGEHASVWPQMSLDALVDRLGAAQGLYNFPTAWRTGPLAAHGHQHQVALERDPTPEVDLVWATWQVVCRARRA